MTKIEFEITDEQAAHWRPILADWVARQTNRLVKSNTSLDALARIVLFRVVFDVEFDKIAQQAVEALDAESEGK
mgnify:CR=1 FL=1